MKKMKAILCGGLAMTFTLCFTNCNDKATTTESKAQAVATEAVKGLRIAYVETDSLLTKYRFWNDLNDAMIQKEENIRTTLNQRGKQLEKEMIEFQRKLENNGFLSRERAEQEQTRLLQKQRELEQLQAKLAADLQKENQKNNIMLRDSINSFLKAYNKDKKYDFIFSNTGFDNILIADTTFNITQEIVDGLNARYKK
ncbi:MAG: OmpH family outer membrane protein [Phocaeicola sp.]|nr:OmpH family outer membrane protein [Phocaeicola sp.]MDD7448685.1 OmpH family outer membrane protein [Prevotellaceae bacterium]MDY3914033.1 OmpH family outer membrane protein [Phocaeicola sp.]MDY5938188.1 OmpH family outer membrane protein [Phocaeicola sp.]